MAAFENHSSKSQRSYNVRFRNDIGVCRRSKRAHRANKPQVLTKGPPALASSEKVDREGRPCRVTTIYRTAPISSNDCDSFVLSDASTNLCTGQRVCDDGTTGASPQSQVAEGAALLLTMSIDSRRSEYPPLSSIPETPDDLMVSAIEASNQGKTSEEQDLAYQYSPTIESFLESNQGEPELSSLTFQDDILPNIPRAVSPLPPWNETPSSDRRFYLQYCMAIHDTERNC